VRTSSEKSAIIAILGGYTSSPSSARATIWHPGVFTIIIIVSLCWWMSCYKLSRFLSYQPLLMIFENFLFLSLLSEERDVRFDLLAVALTCGTKLPFKVIKAIIIIVGLCHRYVPMPSATRQGLTLGCFCIKGGKDL